MQQVSDVRSSCAVPNREAAVTASNPIQERLEALGIMNGRQLADHVQAPASILFLTKGKDGEDDPRAELHYREHGSHLVQTFRPAEDVSKRIGQMRASCVQQAKNWAAHELKLSDWRRAAFPSCWLPTESIAKMQAELAARDAETD